MVTKNNQRDLDQLYLDNHFERGDSRKSDEAILCLMNALHRHEGKESYSGADWETTWQELLKTLLAEFPKISLYNLVQLELPLSARGLHQENLVVGRIAVELYPQSSENLCFLGHAYRNVGDLESAATYYIQAYDLVTRRITKNKIDPSNPLYLDASDYLCSLAKVQLELRRLADALVNAMKALTIVNKAGAKFKESRVYELLQLICLGMELEKLAEHYRLRAVESKKHSPP